MAGRTLGIGMIGFGTVGKGVAKLLRDHGELYTQRLSGVKLELKRVLVRDVDRHRGNGLVADDALTTDADAFFDTAGLDVIIEVAGGRGVVSEYVRRALHAGKHVITANKALLAAEGAELFDIGRRSGACIAFEASCAGGIPVVTALQFGLMGNRVDALYGILNGTCNYILSRMTQDGMAYDDALKQAQELGYAEADPALDVSGMDAAQKLAVLASIAFGAQIDEGSVACEGIDHLALDDIRFGAELGYDIKLLAIAEQTDKGLSLRVHPSFVRRDAMVAHVRGSFNALSVYGSATGHTMYYGRGAGELPTAGAVVSDLLNVAAGWYPAACGAMDLLPDRTDKAVLADAGDLVGRFYLRLNAKDVPGVVAQATQVIGDCGISIAAVMQHEVNVGQFVPLVIVTHDATQGAVREAVAGIEGLDVIDGPPVVIRIVEFPGE